MTEDGVCTTVLVGVWSIDSSVWSIGGGVWLIAGDLGDAVLTWWSSWIGDARGLDLDDVCFSHCSSRTICTGEGNEEVMGEKGDGECVELRRVVIASIE